MTNTDQQVSHNQTPPTEVNVAPEAVPRAVSSDSAVSVAGARSYSAVARLLARAYGVVRAAAQPGLQAARAWAAANTTIPATLAQRWHHPLVPFVAAVLLEVIATGIQLLLSVVFPAFALPAALNILAVVLIALTCGGFPSLVASVSGALLVEYFLLLPRYTIDLSGGKNLAEFILLVSVGIAVSTLASRNEVSKRTALANAANLNRERRRLEAIIQAVPDAITIHDVHGGLVQWNQAAATHGVPDRAITTLHQLHQQYEIRDAAGNVLAAETYPLARALKGEVVSGMQVNYATASGIERNLYVSAAPVRDASGQIEGAVTVSHDIGALLEAQRTAAERTRQLEVTFAATADGILRYDVSSQQLEINPALQRMLRLSDQNELAALPSDARAALFAPRLPDGTTLPREAWPLQRVLQGDILTDGDTADILMRTRDGETVQFNISGAPLRTSDGTVTGAILAFRDVTERRRLEQRSYATLGALLAIAETLVEPPTEENVVAEASAADSAEPVAGPPTGALPRTAQRVATLICTVLECRRVAITLIEAETERMQLLAVVGLTPEQEAHYWAEQRQRTEHAQSFKEASDPIVRERLRAGELVIIDRTQQPHDQTPNPYGVTTQLVAPMLAGEQLVGVLALDFGGTPHDFTAEERSLASTIAQLSALILERERLVLERASATADALAQTETNKRMSQFLSMASHELRTPITAIGLNAQIARTRLDTLMKLARAAGSTEMEALITTLTKLVARVEDSNERQDRLVNDLLDASRTRVGRLDILPEPCDLTALVEHAVQEQRVANPQRDIRLEQPKHGIPLLADAVRISQVVTNLTTNALKYSAPDQPVVINVTADGHWARVTVLDHGQGIAPTQLDQVWQLYYRVPDVKVLSGSGVGLGLGLHLAREIVERHGGQVGVESTLGSGSTFWFTLPIDATHK